MKTVHPPHLVVLSPAYWPLWVLLVFLVSSLLLGLFSSPSGRTGLSLKLFTSASSLPPPSGLGTWPRILQEKVIRFLLIHFYAYEHPDAINKNLSQSLCRLQCMISLFILFYMHGTLCHWIITNTLRSKIGLQQTIIPFYKHASVVKGIFWMNRDMV